MREEQFMGPGNNGLGVMVAKQLSVIDEQFPVYVININLYSVKLKKVYGVNVSLLRNLVPVTQHKPLKIVPEARFQSSHYKEANF